MQQLRLVAGQALWAGISMHTEACSVGCPSPADASELRLRRMACAWLLPRASLATLMPCWQSPAVATASSAPVPKTCSWWVQGYQCTLAGIRASLVQTLPHWRQHYIADCRGMQSREAVSPQSWACRCGICCHGPMRTHASRQPALRLCLSLAGKSHILPIAEAASVSYGNWRWHYAQS